MAVSPILVSAVEGYALWAETWDAAPSPIVALEERMLAPWIERVRPRHAIDVGCGTGRWSARLSALGFDSSSAMLQVAGRKPVLAGRLVLAAATALPIAAGSTDLVLCALTLAHIRDQSSALAEFARVLEPGGTLLLTDFHPEAAAQGWRRTFRHDGQVYELENYPYAIAGLCSASAGVLTCREVIDARIGEPERPLFDLAGRPELFNAACTAPAVQLSWWTRL